MSQSWTEFLDFGDRSHTERHRHRHRHRHTHTHTHTFFKYVKCLTLITTALLHELSKCRSMNSIPCIFLSKSAVCTQCAGVCVFTKEKKNTLETFCANFCAGDEISCRGLKNPCLSYKWDFDGIFAYQYGIQAHTTVLCIGWELSWVKFMEDFGLIKSITILAELQESCELIKLLSVCFPKWISFFFWLIWSLNPWEKRLSARRPPLWSTILSRHQEERTSA